MKSIRKQNLRRNLTHKHRYKNTNHNNNKLTPVMCKCDTCNERVEFIQECKISLAFENQLM